MVSDFSFAEDTVGFIIDGTVNHVTINRLQLQIEEKFTVFDKIKLYLEDGNIENFSLSAIVKEIVFKMENNHRFEKIALVTDRKWIHLCGAIENLFAAGEIRSFTSDERLDALAWLSEM